MIQAALLFNLSAKKENALGRHKSTAAIPIYCGHSRNIVVKYFTVLVHFFAWFMNKEKALSLPYIQAHYAILTFPASSYIRRNVDRLSRRDLYRMIVITLSMQSNYE